MNKKRTPCAVSVFGMEVQGMRILSTKRIRGQQYMVTLQGDEQLDVMIDASTFDHAGYHVDGEISAEQLQMLLETSKYNRVRSRALYYLSGRDYAAGELSRKLTRMTEKETADAVVARLEEVGLINDEAYAIRLAQSLSEYRQYPRRRILQELRARGIDRETAEVAVQEADIDDDKQALALLTKKYYNKLSDDAARQKTLAALVRHGFTYDTARRAMDAVSAQKEGLD